MPKRSNPIVGILYALLLTITAPGCIALALGSAGTAENIVYIDGNLSNELEASVSEINAATLRALEGLEMPLQENTLSGSRAKVRSRYSDSQTVWVDIERGNASTSKITIRVGTHGNKRRSIYLLDAIKAKL